MKARKNYFEHKKKLWELIASLIKLPLSQTSSRNTDNETKIQEASETTTSDISKFALLQNSTLY